MKRYFKILYGILLASFVLTSCEGFLDVDPDEVLPTEEYLGDDQIEARSALFGVLSQMQDITGQYIVLGELRGDVTDISNIAEDELRRINRHDISEDNRFVDPTNLFSIINNCNYALQRLDTVAYENELLENYVSMLRIRTWAQMQIVINYGVLPFMTEPVESDKDLTKKYPILSYEQAIDSLIQALLPYSDVDNVSTYEGSLGFTIYNMIPESDILLGDLYLWAQDYAMAATYYKHYLDSYVSDAGALYNLTSSYGVSYTGTAGNYSVKTNNWGNIFGESVQGNEVISYIAFSEDYRQSNAPFLSLVKQLAPSELLKLNWSLQSKYFENTVFDQGDNRATVATLNSGDGEVIAKYPENYFIFHRAAHIYLKYAEAINYAGYPAHALAVINQGVYDDAITEGAARFTGNPVSYLNFTQSKYVVVNSAGSVTGGNLGIRGRVGLEPLTIDSLSASNMSDSIRVVGQYILNEAALETAFEGNRWGDLIRAAKENNDHSIVADAVYEKFKARGDLGTAATLRDKLMNPENWFLPLTIPDNFYQVGEN